jgi:hypothetical protein
VVRVPDYRSRDPGFDSRRYQIFWEEVGLERGLLNLVSKTEELLEWKSSGSGGSLRWPCDILYQQKLALTSPIRCDRSVGIVRLLNKATEFSLVWLMVPWISSVSQEEYRNSCKQASTISFQNIAKGLCGICDQLSICYGLTSIWINFLSHFCLTASIVEIHHSYLQDITNISWFKLRMIQSH